MDFNDFDNFTNNTNGDNDPTSLGMSGNFNSNPKKSFDVVTLIISIIGGDCWIFCFRFYLSNDSRRFVEPVSNRNRLCSFLSGSSLSSFCL